MPSDERAGHGKEEKEKAEVVPLPTFTARRRGFLDVEINGAAPARCWCSLRQGALTVYTADDSRQVLASLHLASCELEQLSDVEIRVVQVWRKRSAALKPPLPPTSPPLCSHTTSPLFPSKSPPLCSTPAARRGHHQH